MSEHLDSITLEKLLLKLLLQDKSYLVTVSSTFDKNYFDIRDIGKIVEFAGEYYSRYKEIPPVQAIEAAIGVNNLKEVMDEVDAVDFDFAKHYDYFLDETNFFLKTQSIKQAVLSSVEIINNNGDLASIKELVEAALSKDIRIDIGLDYFGSLGERLKRILSSANVRIPTYYPQLDEYFNGGFPPYTLTAFGGVIHGWKCLDFETKIKVKLDGKQIEINIGDLFNSQRETIECAVYKIHWVFSQTIIRESIKTENIEVLSNVGWIPIDYVIKTVEMKKYVILFESGRELICADRHCIIKSDGIEITADKLNIGDEILSDEGIDIVFDVFKTDEFIEMYDLSLPYHHLYFTNGILSHNSQTLCNFSSRQVLHGQNPVLLTLEMSEDAFAQRYDATFSLKDINRIYTVRDITVQMVKKLRELKELEGRGTLFIKQFSAGAASVNDFRIYLRELLMRGIPIDIIYVDYLQLMKPSTKILDGTMYSRGKKIAEELRGLSFEFKVPIVTLSQLKPQAGKEGIHDLDVYMLQESSAIPATADAIVLFGKDEDALVYENELNYKIVKNRLGGRVGIVDKMYYDARSLKMYDVTEMEVWLRDIIESNDERNLHERR